MFNIFFDECISKKMIDKIEEFVGYHPTPIRIHRLQDHFKPDAKDPDWLSKIDKDWLIITADRGVKSKRQEDKLPLICKQKKIRSVIISAGMHKRKQFYKALGILYCWDDILSLFIEPLGSQYRLRLTDKLKPKLELIYSPAEKKKEIIGKRKLLKN